MDDYDEEKELRAQLVALHREYQALADPLVRRLADIEATRPYAHFQDVMRILDSLPYEVRDRIGARLIFQTACPPPPASPPPGWQD